MGGRSSRRIPRYSGTILTATYQTARDMGLGYFEQLAKSA